MDGACGGRCHVLDIQLPIDEVDFWVDIQGLSDAELCLLCRRHCCGWVGGGILITLLSALNNTRLYEYIEGVIRI